jgi:hypothetical protein
MNKKRQTSHLLLLLSAIAIIGAMSFSAGQILQGAAAQVGKPSAVGAANQTAANNAISSYLPPALMKSILDQTRNTNATKFALHNAIGATTAAMNKTAGTNATSAAAGMNKTAGTNATSAAAGMNKTAGTNATSAAAGMNKTAGTNATSAAAGMNKTAGTNASAIKSVLNILRNTNATSFGAHNIINATKNTTAVKP